MEGNVQNEMALAGKDALSLDSLWLYHGHQERAGEIVPFAFSGPKALLFTEIFFATFVSSGPLAKEGFFDDTILSVIFSAVFPIKYTAVIAPNDMIRRDAVSEI